MSFKKTACLAALLTSLPLAASATSISWDGNESGDRVQKDGNWVVVTKGTESSPYKKTFENAIYDVVYIGHAHYMDGTDAVDLVESSYNQGTLGNGFYLKGQTASDNTYYLYGGVAEGNAQCQSAKATWNQLLFKEGSHVGNAELTGANPSETHLILPTALKPYFYCKNKILIKSYGWVNQTSL